MRGEIEIILRQKKTKNICHQQACPNRIANGSFLNRKDTVKEGNLEHQGGRKIMENKNMDTHNRLLSNFVNYA